MTDVLTPSQLPTATRRWRTVAAGCAAGPVCGAAVAVLANGTSALPFALVVTVLFAAGATWTVLGRGRGGPILLAAVAVSALAFETTFGLAANLVRPASWPTFVGDAFWVLGIAGMLVALGLRGRLRRPRALAGGVAGLAIVAVAVSAGSVALAADPARHPGDVAVRMVSTATAFSCSVPAHVPAGEQTVFVRNDDTTPHQFVVAGSTIEVRAGGTARQAVHIPTGSVLWRCVYFGHEDLTGTAHAG